MKIGKTKFGETCTTQGECENGTDCSLNDPKNIIWIKNNIGNYYMIRNPQGFCLSKYSLFLNLNLIHINKNYENKQESLIAPVPHHPFAFQGLNVALELEHV